MNFFFFIFREALSHFERCVKPGGLLLIDHRNYDYVIETGRCPTKSIYYNVSDGWYLEILI